MYSVNIARYIAIPFLFLNYENLCTLKLIIKYSRKLYLLNNEINLNFYLNCTYISLVDYRLQNP